MSEVRTYRFPARDRSGWLLGLQAGQCVILGSSLVIAGLLVNLRVPFPVIVAVVAAAVVAAFVPVGGRPGYSWVPPATLWLLRRRSATWTTPIPRTTGDGAPTQSQPSWPPFLRGMRIEDCDGWQPGTRMGVIVDRTTGSATGMLRVTGRKFALIDRVDQERLVSGWGDALAGFCKERSPVRSIGWFEWVAPADPSDHLRWARDHIGPNADPQFVEAYMEMAGSVGPMSTRHETLVTVTVAGPGRSWLQRRPQTDAAAGLEALRDQLGLLARRLDDAGLAVDPPLGVSVLVGILRTRLDPFAPTHRPGSGNTLAELAGLGACHAGPTATCNNWSHVKVDRTNHATFAIAEWPRLDVAANWMEPLLLQTGGVRTVAVHLFPVAPSRSHRRVDRDSTKLVVDAEQRNRSGFRIGARHRRVEADVADREAELVAGYGELEFCGLIGVAAPEGDVLERSCAEWEQVAAQTGLFVRRLDAQHDFALACTLPVGIVPSARTVE